MVVYVFAHHLYLLICSVKLNLRLIDVQGVFVVASRQISKGAIFPGPEYKLVAGVCAMGMIKLETLAVHCEWEGVHEVQQLRRKMRIESKYWYSFSLGGW